MIFLSHNHRDKAIVEQIALRLRSIFGVDNVFYDSWSIQPGDGIIDKMNTALSNCKIFLFFVSNHSLSSNMVKLEWQNALLKATNGDVRIIPVKLDDCLMPAVLLQTLYIDLFSSGIEVAVRQIIDVAEGRNIFLPNSGVFSNLNAEIKFEGSKCIVTIRANHFMEPISRFLILVENPENELQFKVLNVDMFAGGFNKNVMLDDGRITNAQLVAIERATVPNFPFIVEIIPKTGSTVKIRGIMHQKSSEKFSSIPLSSFG